MDENGKLGEEVEDAPVHPLRHQERVHRLELREPLLHLVGHLSNANLEIVISFGLVIDDSPLYSKCPSHTKYKSG